jgi:hypothetical protein
MFPLLKTVTIVPLRNRLPVISSTLCFSLEANFELERELERLKLLRESMERTRDQLARGQLSTRNRFHQNTDHHVFTSCPAAMLCVPKSRSLFLLILTKTGYFKISLMQIYCVY